MTPAQRMEEISKVYLHAVAAQCGYAIGTWSQDQSCVDVTIAAAGVFGEFADPKVDVQLKATSDPKNLASEHLAISVNAKQYEKLRLRTQVQKILVGLVLPTDDSTWIEVAPEQLAIRKCAYFAVTAGLPPLEHPFVQSKTIQLPFTQIFSPAALRGIMKTIGNGLSL
jgi:Domain of unknown function (DUF4365)